MAHLHEIGSVFRRLGIATEPERTAQEEAQDRAQAAKEEAKGRARRPKRRLGKRLTAGALEARGKGRRKSPEAAKTTFSKIRRQSLTQCSRTI